MQTKSGIRLGIALPQGFPDGRVDLKLVRDFSQRAEALGYDDLWTIEQITGRLATLEAVTVLAYVSAITSRVRLGTSVLVTNLRNPVVLAKQLASIDHLSGGRLTVGVGLGTNTRPYPVFGVDPERRVARVEGVRVMKALWTQPEANLDGDFWKLQATSMEPKPVQRPSIPLWFGARVPDALRRAVRLGDGWMGAGSEAIADFRDQIATVRGLLAEAGRDPATFGISKRVYVAVDRDARTGLERLRPWLGGFYGNPEVADRWAVCGTAPQVLEVLSSLVEAGVNHLMLHPVYDNVRHMETIASDIAPKL